MLTRHGDNLVLAFERSGRGGNTLGVVMTLTLDGEMVNATQDLDFGVVRSVSAGPARSSRANGAIGCTTHRWRPPSSLRRCAALG